MVTSGITAFIARKFVFFGIFAIGCVALYGYSTDQDINSLISGLFSSLEPAKEYALETIKKG